MAKVNRETVVAEALDLLDDYGWIRSTEVPAGAQGGRPTTAFVVNPKALTR